MVFARFFNFRAKFIGIFLGFSLFFSEWVLYIPLPLFSLRKLIQSRSPLS